MINKLLSFEYRPGARGDNGTIDCWGLTILARRELFGRDDLPDFPDARYSRKGSVQAAYADQSARMVKCERKAGAVVAVMRRQICVHIAIVLGDGSILEIKREGSRARVTPWLQFKRQYPAPMWTIEFYD